MEQRERLKRDKDEGGVRKRGQERSERFKWKKRSRRWGGGVRKAGRHPGEDTGKGLKRWEERRSVEKRGWTQEGITPVAHPACCFCRSPMDSSCLAFKTHTLLPFCLTPLCFFREDYHSFLYRYRGLRVKKKKNTSVYIYLKMDCQCLNHTQKNREAREGERQKGKVILKWPEGVFCAGKLQGIAFVTEEM